MWWNLAIGLVLTAVSYFLRPKPEQPQIKAATLDDFKIPQTKEGVEIRKIYGTVWIDDPQIVWYGDLKTVAIKSSSGGKK